jgi:hypothetical protein
MKAKTGSPCAICSCSSASRIKRAFTRRGDATGELRARLEAEQAKVGILEDVVRDLRQRLDAEAEERRRLTAILADQRTVHPTGSTVEPVSSPARRRWWGWRG